MRPHTDLDKDAVRRGHRVGVTVDLWTPAGFVAKLPIVTGDLTWSLSTANGMRSGKLTLPGYEWWPIVEPGQATWVAVTVAIEGSTWDMGQFPILRASVTRPGGLVTLDLGDWSYRRSVPMAEAEIMVGATNQSLAAMVKQWMDGTLPPITITRDDSNGATATTPIKVALGGNIWSAMVKVCEQRDMIPVMTSRGTAEIRDYNMLPYTDRYDRIDGTIIKETAGVNADEGANRAICVLDSEDTEAPDIPPQVRTLTTGPYRYDKYGYGATAIVVTERVPYATTAAAVALAERTYVRRLGIMRTHTLEVVPMPWVEAGDVLEWRPSFGGDDPDLLFTGHVDTVTFPLTAEGSQRIVLRTQIDKGAAQ